MRPNICGNGLCGKPSTRVCGNCFDAPGSTLRMNYCSAECQENHRPTHDQLCDSLLSRKILFNAGSLLQDIFYIYREKTFEKCFQRIESRGGKLHIWLKSSALGGGIYDQIVPFPLNLVQNENDKKAILTLYSCEDASAWMTDLIAYFLPDGKFPRIRKFLEPH